MPDIDRRKLLHASMAFAVPFASVPIFSGCEVTSESVAKKIPAAENEQPEALKTRKPNSRQKTKANTMQIHYLEIVTDEAEKLVKQYSAIHGVTFAEPEPNLGNACVAEIEGGGKIAIRGPLRDGEAPVIRPYTLVENIDDAVAAAKEAGAEIAIEKMEIPGHGTIAIVIQGGIECGFWQSAIAK